MPHEHSDNKAKRHKRQTRLYPNMAGSVHNPNDAATEEPETDAATLTSIGAGLADPHTVLSLTTRLPPRALQRSEAIVPGYRRPGTQLNQRTRGIEWSCQTWSATELCKVRA